MARGVNKAILIGNLGQDPEVRYTAKGSAVCNLSLATTESWKNRETGERQEETEWHRLVFFGRLAEIVGEYLHKGSQIYVEGRLQTRKWQDQSGNDRYNTEIVVSDMQILGRRTGGDTAHYDRSDRQRQGGAQPGAGRPAPKPVDTVGGGADATLEQNDDIPF